MPRRIHWHRLWGFQTSRSCLLKVDAFLCVIALPRIHDTANFIHLLSMTIRHHLPFLNLLLLLWECERLTFFFSVHVLCLSTALLSHCHRLYLCSVLLVQCFPKITPALCWKCRTLYANHISMLQSEILVVAAQCAWCIILLADLKAAEMTIKQHIYQEPWMLVILPT